MEPTTVVAVWKKTDALVLIHRSEFYKVVEFPFDILFDQFELGPDEDFEIIGEL